MFFNDPVYSAASPLFKLLISSSYSSIRSEIYLTMSSHSLMDCYLLWNSFFCIPFINYSKFSKSSFIVESY